MAQPKRRNNSLEELFELFPGAKDIFIGGTESPIQRPKDNEKQKESYSGKKKAHTRKNILISDINRWIGFRCEDKAENGEVLIYKKKLSKIITL